MPGPASRNPARRGLLVVGVLEAVSLLVLLGNLATVHLAGVARAVGPVHGSLYLIAVALVWSGGHPPRARWLALVPGVGALLADRVLRAAPGTGGPDPG